MTASTLAYAEEHLQRVVRIHPNLKLLSHSSDVLLHKCPRKYELYKMLGKPKGGEEGDEHLAFGTTVGIGIQELLISGDMMKAYWKAMLSWRTILDDDAGERDKKTFWYALYSLDKFSTLQKTLLANYKLAYLNGRPATELGFSIDCGDGFYYRGFIDAVFIDTLRNELVVLENKTTKFRNVHEAVYKHSGQSLGYSLIADIIAQEVGTAAGSSYKVLYAVYKSLALEWEVFPFIKSHTMRANWIRQLLIDKQHIAEYAENEYFPMHGENCYDFFRPCEFFGMCELSNKHLVGEVKEQVEPESKYDYHFKLSELIESQLAKGEL